MLMVLMFCAVVSSLVSSMVCVSVIDLVARCALISVMVGLCEMILSLVCGFIMSVWMRL